MGYAVHLPLPTRNIAMGIVHWPCRQTEISTGLHRLSPSVTVNGKWARSLRPWPLKRRGPSGSRCSATDFIVSPNHLALYSVTPGQNHHRSSRPLHRSGFEAQILQAPGLACSIRAILGGPGQSSYRIPVLRRNRLHDMPPVARQSSGDLWRRLCRGCPHFARARGYLHYTTPFLATPV
jgi:hypothetical protein